MDREKRVLLLLKTMIEIRGDRPAHVAERLGVHPSHVYNALRVEAVSPTLMRAAVSCGWVGPERVRFSGDVDEDLRERLSEVARRRRLTNGELIELLALTEVTIDEL